MPEREEDPVDFVGSAPKRMFDFLAEMYKVQRDKAEQRRMQEYSQQQQDALQKQNQQFMSEQNQKLMDAFKQSNIPATDDNIKLAKDELKRLGEIADKEVEAQERIDGIDERLGAIDQESHDLLNPDPTKPSVDPSKRLDDLQKLNGEKAQLQKEKAGLQDQLKELETERQGIMKGEGLKELEGLDQNEDIDVDVESPGFERTEVSEGVERGKPQLGTSRMKSVGKTGPLRPSPETLSDISTTPLETVPLESMDKQGVQGTGLENPGAKKLAPKPLPKSDPNKLPTPGNLSGGSSSPQIGEGMGQGQGVGRGRFATFGGMTRELSQIKPDSTFAKLIKDNPKLIHDGPSLGQSEKLGQGVKLRSKTVG